MDTAQRALSEPYYLLLDEPEFGAYWVAELDCGLVVYQCPNDDMLDQPQPWLRLKQFCKDLDCKICALSYCSSSKKIIKADSGADGYYFSNKIIKAIMPLPQPSDGISFVGIGSLKDSKLTINWVNLCDYSIDIETRDLLTTRLRSSLGLIS